MLHLYNSQKELTGILKLMEGSERTLCGQHLAKCPYSQSLF